MSDIFNEDMPFNFIDEIANVIKASPDHRLWFLAKRPHIMQKYFKNRNVTKNLWLGTTVECREENLQNRYLTLVRGGYEVAFV